MKVITIANQKGGTGKTTIAVNLTVCALRDGLKSVLVNADTQPSSFDFAMDRARDKIEPTVPCTNIINGRLHEQIAKYSKADLIIIDTGSEDTPEFRSSIAAADILVIPIQSGKLDVQSTKSTIELAKEIQKSEMKLFLLINRDNPSFEYFAKTKATLQGLGVPIFKTVLHDYYAYSLSVSEGRSVIEFCDISAENEMKRLWKEVLNKLKGKSSRCKPSGVKMFLLELPGPVHKRAKIAATTMEMTLHDYIVSVIRAAS